MSSFSIFCTGVDGDPKIIPNGVDIVVSQYNSLEPGGPVRAELLANGPSSALADLFDWLGAELEIRTSRGTPIWWGRVTTVLIRFGGMEFGLTTVGMINKVAVDYTTERIGGASDAFTTDWVDDSDSIERYGIHQHLERRSNISTERAEFIRDQILARKSRPIALPTQISLGSHGCRIECEGFYQAFQRVFYTQDNGLEEYITGQVRAIPVGLGFTSSKIGFDDVNDAIHTIEGQVVSIPSGTRIRVSGSSSNDGLKTVDFGTTLESKSIIATTISFNAPDEVNDSANGLDFVNGNDMVQISGSASGGNNRYSFVDSGTTDGSQFIIHDEDGGALTNRVAGDTISITRANSIRVGESLTHELPSGSVTVTADGMYVAQQFSPVSSDSWTVAQIAIRCKRVGSPSDNLRVELCADAGGGVPSTSLDSGEIEGDLLPDSSSWVVFDLSGGSISVNPGSVYWIKVSRTGSNDFADYYTVDASTDLQYSRGVMRTWDGSQYNIYDPDADMFFKVIGAVETTTQISTIITETSDLLVDLNVSSALKTNQYREGRATALTEIGDLIASGTIYSEEIQLLISPDKVVHLRAKPDASPDDEWVFSEDGVLFLPSGEQVELGVLPVGRWVTLGVDMGLRDILQTLSPFYCVGASFDAVNNVLSLNPSEESYFDIGGIRQ